MDFVTFEIAKKLKEKGFREKVNAYYGKHENIFDVHPSLDMNDSDYRCSAPTIAQVLKWLREEKKMHLIVEIADSGWYHTVYPNIRWENGKLKSDTYIMSFKEKESYEQASLAGIEYVLDNLI
jgi:hypothetical protein